MDDTEREGYKRDLYWSLVNMQGSVHNHISKPLTGIQTENFCIMQPFSIILEKSWQSGKVSKSSVTGEKGI